MESGRHSVNICISSPIFFFESLKQAHDSYFVDLFDRERERVSVPSTCPLPKLLPNGSQMDLRQHPGTSMKVSSTDWQESNYLSLHLLPPSGSINRSQSRSWSPDSSAGASIPWTHWLPKHMFIWNIQSSQENEERPAWEDEKSEGEASFVYTVTPAAHCQRTASAMVPLKSWMCRQRVKYSTYLNENRKELVLSSLSLTGQEENRTPWLLTTA